MTKLRLTPAATISPNSQGIILQSDLGAFQLHGKDISDFIETVIPLLNGEYDEESICQTLEQYENDSIRTVLELLNSKGLLEQIKSTGDASPPWSVHQRFFSAWNTSGSSAVEKLANARVLVLGTEPWAANAVQQLAMAGVGHIHLVDNANLCSDDRVSFPLFSIADLHKSRAEMLALRVGELAPWCQLTHKKLTVDSKGSLNITENEWQLVIVSFASEAIYWQKAASNYIQKYNCKALYGCLDGLDSLLGPVVIPGETACWNCLRLRRLGTSENPQLAHQLESDINAPQQRARTLLAPMASLLGQKIALESIKLLTDYAPTLLKDKVEISNLVTGESDQHGVIPMPWCEVCGGADTLIKNNLKTTVNQTPMINQTPMQAVTMSAVSSAGSSINPLNHVADIDQLHELLKGWISPITGVIRQLTGHLAHLPSFPITASAGVSSFTAGEFDPRAMGQIGSGKGLDEISAHISAFGEAIERYSAARYAPNSLKYCKINQLGGDAIDPDTLVLYSKSQYQMPQFPFSPWRKNQKIHWTKGTWLGTQKAVWVPALVSYFNFNAPYEEQFSQVSSNGLAAGQDNDDAAVRACYELIERDAMMLTWYAQLPSKRLQLEPMYEGKLKVLIDEIASRNISLELYLLDVGVHVPTVVCLALGDGYSAPAVSVSLATHGDINVAMRKALLEQGHVMPYLCQLMASGHRRPVNVNEVRSLEDHAAYYFSPDKRSAFDFMRKPAEHAIDPNEWTFPKVSGPKDIQERLQQAGAQVAIIDVTSPDVALSPFRVARAVGVHMQPIHFGEQYKRVNNPRLRRLLAGRQVNQNPHPIA